MAKRVSNDVVRATSKLARSCSELSQRASVLTKHYEKVYTFESRMPYFVRLASHLLEMASEALCHPVNIVSGVDPFVTVRHGVDAFGEDSSDVEVEDVARSWTFDEAGEIHEVIPE